MISVRSDSAAAIGVTACPHCRLLQRFPRIEVSTVLRCPRCKGRVSPRKPQSLQRSWAFVVCAAICYIPANTLPILTVVQFGSGQPDTILSGVVHLFAEGQWPIAILVFVASVFVPLLKILVLMVLLLSIQFRSAAVPRERTKLFHFIDVLGRWSMIDIFMISILVALVQLGTIATVEAGAGAAYFGVVVVCTMLSAISFDPRLVWDAAARDD